MAYFVRITNHYYAGAITRKPNPSYVGRHGDYPYAPLEPFQNHAAARAWIMGHADQYCLLGNGECALPTFRAVPARCVPAHIREIAGV